MESSVLEGKPMLHAPLINAIIVMAPTALESANMMLDGGSSQHPDNGAKD